MPTEALICDAIRTPFGRYGGALSSIRTDDLGALPIKALIARNPGVDWAQVADVIYGCANQAGEDNRNVCAHGRCCWPGCRWTVPGSHHQPPVRFGHGRGRHGRARHQKSGETELMIVSGVASMSRAPFVTPEAESGIQPRSNAVYDTTIGWRFVNKLMKEHYGVDSMPETAELVATDFRHRARGAGPLRAGLASSRRSAAQKSQFLRAARSRLSTIPQKKGDPVRRRHWTSTRARPDWRRWPGLTGVVRPDGTMTAGNASGVNAGSCALILASEAAAARHGLTPRARVDRRWPPPMWRRASWASVRRRPRARCWR